MTRRPASFGAALTSSWAILLGFGILMLGDGLQGTLLAVRADLEGFSATLTGLVMSTFYLGFLLGSIMTPRITVRVGHIRVFAAFAALSSAAILVHALFVTLPVWIAMRLLSGFCFAGLYIVAESWLNDRASNETRGKLLSLYMVITYIGVGAGQLLLNLADPFDFELFILVSILISLAVVPLLLSAGSSPKFHDSVRISLLQLYRLTPLGLVSMFAVGMVTATFFALGPVYAQRIGLDIRDTSYFMSAAVVGTVLAQGPIGALSDRFDRRRVLTLVTILTAISAAVCIPAEQVSTVALFFRDCVVWRPGVSALLDLYRLYQRPPQAESNDRRQRCAGVGGWPRRRNRSIVVRGIDGLFRQSSPVLVDCGGPRVDRVVCNLSHGQQLPGTARQTGVGNRDRGASIRFADRVGAASYQRGNRVRTR